MVNFKVIDVKLIMLQLEQFFCIQLSMDGVVAGFQYINFGLRKKGTHPWVKRTQFHLTLTWICTVHKVHVMSLDNGVIPIDLHKQRSF